ncbi:MAG: diguanylate cyclase, partial [Myxococcales bacterium]|nr:diguanylate cyclase [Myxococcales bacterium]
QDERYFEGMRLFHEHYMPSQEILQHGLAELEPLPIQRIAPQHGGVIPEALVRPAMAFLDKVECGLYLSSKHDHDVRRMSAVNRALRQAVRLLTVTHQLPELVQGLTEIVQDVLPVRDIQLYGSWADGLMLLDSATRFRGVPAALPNHLAPWMGICRDRWSPATSFITDPEGAPLVALPLFSMEGECARHLAVLELSAPIEADALAVHILEELSTPLEVALDREMLLREVQQRRQELYELATRDALTGLYNRHYFHGAAARMAALQDRGRGGTLVVSMLDIDRFKDINDTFGHAAGDIVLARLALALQETIREEDLAVRMGGEEIAVFHLHHPHTDDEEELAERIRQATEALDFGPLLGGRKITLSGGVAARRPRESLDSVLQRADQALYAAKQAGRNRVIVAAELEAEPLPTAVGHPLRRPSQVGAPLRGGMAALRPPSRFRVPRRGGVE